MKKEVNPLAAVAAVIVILVIAAFAYWRYENRAPAPGAAANGAMPPQVTEELQKRMGRVQPPAAPR